MIYFDLTSNLWWWSWSHCNRKPSLQCNEVMLHIFYCLCE